MGKIVWSKRGDASLERIRKFYAKKSITAAEKILEKDYRRAIVRSSTELREITFGF